MRSAVVVDFVAQACWVRPLVARKESKADCSVSSYQEARSDPASAYSRIGWHSDWQAGPHLDRWPSTAVTVHLDGGHQPAERLSGSCR